jgi:hypothetical protein
MNSLYCQNEGNEDSFEIGINLIKQNTFYHFDIDRDDIALKTSNYAYGVSLSIPIKKFISIRSGLQLSNQGQSFLIVASEDTYGFPLTYYSAELTLQYIKLPFEIKLGGDKSNKKRLTLNFSLGPQLSFLKSATSIVEGIDNDYDEFMNNATIDIVGSIGVDFKIIKNLYFNLAYRFDNSITSAAPKRTLNPYSKTKITTHNRTTGCLFGLSAFFN